MTSYREPRAVTSASRRGSLGAWAGLVAVFPPHFMQKSASAGTSALQAGHVRLDEFMAFVGEDSENMSVVWMPCQVSGVPSEAGAHGLTIV